MEVLENINRVLPGLLRSINEAEEHSICKDKLKNVTLNEIHVIEAIGVDQPKNMSAVARNLDITTGTLTISVNSLVKKGLVSRRRGEEDRRVVFLSLTDFGKQAYASHAAFHEKLVRQLSEELSGEELEALNRALICMNKFAGDIRG